jgi:hypothetical protein
MQRQKKREDEFKKMKKLIEGKSSAKECEAQRKFYCPASKKKNGDKIELCLGNAKACAQATGDEAKIEQDIKTCRSNSKKDKKQVVCVTPDGMTCEEPKKCNPRENAPMPSCQDGEVKCRDLTCVKPVGNATAKETCGNRNSTVTCGADLPVLCPDGMNCAESLKECARFAGWNGCPPEKEACEGDRLACVDDKKQCKQKTGCDAGKVPCGIKWNRETFKKEGKICMAPADCKRKVKSPKSEDMKPERQVLEGLSPKANFTKEVKATGGDPIMRLKAKKGACRKAGNESDDGTVNFAVLPVPDSDLTDGPFSAILDSLLSPVVSVVPDTAVNITEDIDLEFPVLDDLAQENATFCDALLKVTTLVSYSQELADGGVYEATKEPSFCKAGDKIGKFSCVCKIGVRHFTTFAIQQSGDVGSTSGSGSTPAPDGSTPAPDGSSPGSNPATAAPTAKSSGLGGGAIAGIIIGSILGVALIGGAIMALGSRNRAAARRRDQFKPDLDL